VVFFEADGGAGHMIWMGFSVTSFRILHKEGGEERVCKAGQERAGNQCSGENLRGRKGDRQVGR
jgi:hypothetical protein